MRLTIARGERPSNPGGPVPEARTVTYEVPEFEGMTVLDALNWIRRHRDPSLAVRFSCRSANACRECVALVDKRPTYTCTARATGEVAVEPLPNRPLLRDLATDL